MAEWSQELTTFLHHMRSDQRAIDKANADSLARHQELRALPHVMLTDLEFGYSPAEVMRPARRRFNISDQYARLAVQHARRIVKKRAKRRRDLLIVRLAGRGWSNERIGRRVGASTRTVARVLKRYLRPNWNTIPNCK